MAGILYPSDIVMIQNQAQQALLPELCTIQRYTPSSNNQGGQSDAWANAYTAVPCHLALASKILTSGGEIMTEAARVMQDPKWMVTLPAGTDITEKDRLVITTLGRTLQVTNVIVQSWELVTRVLASEIL